MRLKLEIRMMVVEIVVINVWCVAGFDGVERGCGLWKYIDVG